MNELEEISAFRRILPQFLAAIAKNLIILNLGEYIGFRTIVLPSLMGINPELNPYETVQITADETSWLSSCSVVMLPLGCLLSGPICDKIGRRKTILMVTIPLIITWAMLGFARSFLTICIGFASLGFCMGLKESPSQTYVSEISEPIVRGKMAIMTLLSVQLGYLLVMVLGLTFTWRQISLICAILPLACFVAVLFVPESPSWLLLNNRSKDAEKSLQWLRGWVSPQTIHKEFIELQNYSKLSSACVACAKQSTRCDHPKPTFCDKIMDLKRKRTLKAVSLVFCLYFFYEFSILAIWTPYLIQVLMAYGTPIDANVVPIYLCCVCVFSSIVMILTVKKLGRRRLYLICSLLTSLFTFALSVYGFVFFPSGFTSFEKHSTEQIQSATGNYSYLALALMVGMNFFATPIVGLPQTYLGEVFSLNSRSFYCGIATAGHYVITTIATKSYYNVETWFSLSGATAFYGFISLAGTIVMFYILPETEQRSLEDIERHYSDNSKSITDIHISKQSI